MKHILTALFLIGSIAFAYAQEAKLWNIDKSHASIQFSVDHFFSAVPGKFRDFDGEIRFDPANLKGSKVNFSIDVKSVDTDEADRDEHLQSADFFHAEKWPTMKFTSTSFTKKSDNQYDVKGKLTIRDVTKEVTLPLEVKGRMDNPWKEGYEILGIAINTEINRTEYGVGSGSWAATAVVGDDVDVSISMELDAKK